MTILHHAQFYTDVDHHGNTYRLLPTGGWCELDHATGTFSPVVNVGNQSELTKALKRAKSTATSVTKCGHPPTRVYAWTAADGVFRVCCSACGAILKGTA